MTHVIQLPPRQEMAAAALEKLKRGEQLTDAEQRQVILALPRKTRRKHKIRTTPIREEVAALRTMRIPGEGKDVERKARNKSKAVRRRREPKG